MLSGWVASILYIISVRLWFQYDNNMMSGIDANMIQCVIFSLNEAPGVTSSMLSVCRNRTILCVFFSLKGKEY